MPAYAKRLSEDIELQENVKKAFQKWHTKKQLRFKQEHERRKATERPGADIARDHTDFLNMLFHLKPQMIRELEAEVGALLPPANQPYRGQADEAIDIWLERNNLNAPWLPQAILETVYNWKFFSGEKFLYPGANKYFAAPSVTTPIRLPWRDQMCQLSMPLWDTSENMRPYLGCLATTIADNLLIGSQRYFEAMLRNRLQFPLQERIKKSTPQERMAWLVKFVLGEATVEELKEEFARTHPEDQIEDSQAIRRKIKSIAKRLELKLPTNTD